MTGPHRVFTVRKGEDMLDLRLTLAPPVRPSVFHNRSGGGYSGHSETDDGQGPLFEVAADEGHQATHVLYVKHHPCMDMYGIYLHERLIFFNMVNVVKYTIHVMDGMGLVYKPP